jgi:hypothetical protein
MSCQFLPPGGSMGLRYMLQVLSSETHKTSNNSEATETKEKNKQRFGILRILENF